MGYFNQLSLYVIPCVVAAIVLYGLFRRVPVFESFLAGAKQGLHTAYNLLPALTALVVAVSMLRASGAMDALVHLLAPLARILGIPQEVLPLMAISPISGSGSLSLYESLLTAHGPDSYIGRVASVVMGSTETTFYAVTVYYGSIGISKSRYTIPAALLGDMTSFVCSALSVRLLFGG